MTAPTAHPRFSIVTAVYDVEPYLPAFVDSVEGLRIASGDLEIIAVDDGSNDGSLGRLREWARQSRFTVTVLTKANGGQGSARNLGLDHATGAWVTFPDPDDQLDPDYLGAGATFAEAHPEIAVMSARPVLLREGSGRRLGGHPRAWQYRAGNRTADLLDEPNVFLGVSSGSFFRRDRISAAALRFDARIRPNFEDAHFAVRYLLDLPRPVIGLLRDSVYVYRKREAGTSTLQGSMRHPGRYSSVLEHGYLDVIQRGRPRDGSVPAWLQHLLIYELSWYLSEDERAPGTIDVPPELAPRFHELFERILRELDPAVVAAHGVRALRPAWADVLAHAGRDEKWHSPGVVRSRRGGPRGTRPYVYRYVGQQPAESFGARGGPVVPAAATTEPLRSFGRELLWERTIWLPDRPGLEISLDGQVLPIETDWYLARPAGRRAHWRPLEPAVPRSPEQGARVHRFARMATRVAAGGPSDARRRVASGMLFLDRLATPRAGRGSPAADHAGVPS